MDTLHLVCQLIVAAYCGAKAYECRPDWFRSERNKTLLEKARRIDQRLVEQLRQRAESDLYEFQRFLSYTQYPGTIAEALESDSILKAYATCRNQ